MPHIPQPACGEVDLDLDLATEAELRAALANDSPLAAHIAECRLNLGLPRKRALGSYSIFAIALRLGHHGAAQSLLDAGFHLRPPSAFLEALPAAIHSRSPACVVLALNMAQPHRHHPDFPRHAHAALMAAAECDSHVSIEALLALGAPADPPPLALPPLGGPPLCSPFFSAVLRGHAQSAIALARAGADVDFLARGGGDSDLGHLRGWTPIGIAAKLGRVEQVRLLISLGACVSPKRRLPHRTGMDSPDNPLMALADEHAHSAHDDRLLLLLRAAGVGLDLLRHRSQAYAVLLHMDNEKKTLAAASQPRPLPSLPHGGERRL